jgi:phage protein D
VLTIRFVALPPRYSCRSVNLSVAAKDEGMIAQPVANEIDAVLESDARMLYRRAREFHRDVGSA